MPATKWTMAWSSSTTITVVWEGDLGITKGSWRGNSYDARSCKADCPPEIRRDINFGSGPAWVAEPVDAEDLKSFGRKVVRVQVSSRAGPAPRGSSSEDQCCVE